MARRRVSRGGKKIDIVRWLGFQASSLGLTVGSTGVQLSTAGQIPETIMRTRGQLFGYLDGLPAAGDLVDVAAALHIVPEGTGTTVLQSPITDPNADWFWYTRFAIGYEEYVTDVIDSPVLGGYREMIDSKAMRRAPGDSELQAVFENATIGTAQAINVGIAGRFLLGS